MKENCANAPAPTPQANESREESGIASRKTDAELKQLAIDIRAGKVFTDRHCADPQDVTLVFMILSLMDNKTMKQLQAKDPGLFYEYIEKAGPRGINGMPSFLSMNILSRQETKRVGEFVAALDEAEKGVPGSGVRAPQTPSATQKKENQ